MSPVSVRAATLDDIEGIRTVHATCDDPWSHPGVGPVWVNHRLLRGFYIDVATIHDTVVGHAEWNISQEPAPYGRFLYLGMLQIHNEYQYKGVGRAMVEAGVERARSLACRAVTTIPEPEAYGFYRKCGFEPIRRIAAVDIAVSVTTLPMGWTRVGRIPQTVIDSLPLRLGWSGQACSSFMWEICNHPIRIAGEQERFSCARFDTGEAYVQLRYVGGHSALAIAWATVNTPLEELVKVAQGLAASIGIGGVSVSVIDSESDELESLLGQTVSATAEIWERQV